MTELDGAAKTYVEVIESLHSRWKPHPGQIKLGRALFKENCRWIFGELGRNWGKTEFICYAFWRWAMFTPGSDNYYFAPYAEQADEILWATGRIQSFGPRSWIKDKSETEMRLIFNNGSSVTLAGSDNTEAFRGVKPKNGLIVYDEFKDFRPEFHVAFEPNIVPKEKVDGFGEDSNCSLIILGTPPNNDCQFTEIADEFKSNPNKKYFNGPSSENIYLSRQWLEDKKRELYARGDGDIWEREYEAKRVRGGKKSIFPMLSKTHVVPHKELLHSIYKEMHKMNYYVITDPGTTSVFGNLFIAHHPYTNHTYVFDEIYETDPSKTTTRTMNPEIKKKAEDINRKSEWLMYCDEAAQWFIQEAYANEDCSLEYCSTQKAAVSKEQGLGFIKDALLDKKITISDKCEMLYWEMENYVKDKNGKVPKGNDHLIDCLRYYYAAIGYVAKEEVEKSHEYDDRPQRIKLRDEFSDFELEYNFSDDIG